MQGYSSSDTDSSSAPLARPRNEAGLEAAYHHGQISREESEKRLQAAGKWRYLVRTAIDAAANVVILSYAGSDVKSVVHLKIEEMPPHSGNFAVNGNIIESAKLIRRNLKGAVEMLTVEIAKTLKGKSLFPIRDPLLPAESTVHQAAYTNVSWEVMAAALSQLPEMDRATSEAFLHNKGVVGGFLLRQKGELETYKVAVSCMSSRGKCEHFIMVLVEKEDQAGAQWVFCGKPLTAVAILEAAKELLDRKQITKTTWVGNGF